MKKINLILITLLLLIYSGVSMADRPVALTRDTKTAVNLMDTDLVKKKGLLDCQLRLEGNPPHYKLVYSLGEIPVPALAVKKDFGRSHMLLAVKAMIAGLPVRELFIRYHEGTTGQYKMDMNCHGENAPCDAPVAYVMLVSKPENIVLPILSSRYGENLIVNSAHSVDVNIGAIMIRDRPQLTSPAMDGLNGPKNLQGTNLHYVCATK